MSHCLMVSACCHVQNLFVSQKGLSGLHAVMRKIFGCLEID